jgi:hypothetical protein
VMLVLAVNQNTGAKALQEASAAEVVRCVGEIRNSIFMLLDQDLSHVKLTSMCRASACITDGRGAEMVADYWMNGND